MVTDSRSTNSDTSDDGPKAGRDISRQLGRHAVRQLRLDGIYIFFQDFFSKTATASKKGHVAIYKDRRAASITAAAHLIGVSGVAALGYFVLGEWYIGAELQGELGQDSQKLLALVITAKVFELVAVFSLSSIVFTLVRYEMVLGNGAPLAALGAGLQISDPTFLVSKTMLAIMRGQFSRQWKKFFFVVLVAGFTVLAILIAPATATALMPRLDTWRAGGTMLWWNAAEAAMFPESLNSTHGPRGVNCSVTGDQQCPATEWETLSSRLLSHLPTASRQVNVARVSFEYDGYLLPETLLVDGPQTALQMTVFVRGADYHVLQAPYTIATMANAAVVEGLVKATSYWQRASLMSLIRRETVYHRTRRSSFNIDVKTAVTHTQCERVRDPAAGSNSQTKYLDIGDLADENTANRMRDTLRTNITTPQIQWFDPPPSMATQASIGVLIAIPVPNKDRNMNQTVNLYGCMIDARWANTTLSTHPTGRFATGHPTDFVLGNSVEPGEGWVSDPTFGSHVHIHESFAKLIDPVIQDSNPNANLTVLQELFRRSGVWSPDSSVTSSSRGSPILNRIEAVLGTMVTNAMARINPDVSPMTELVDVGGNGTWWRNFLPQNGRVFGPGGEAFNVSEEEKRRFFGVEMEAYVEGYGYGRDDVAILLSMACMCVYAVAVVIFVVWSVASGVTSTSWDTIVELIAIALKSQPPPTSKLDGVSAGIMTTQPLRQRYCMSADDDTIALMAVDEELEQEMRVRPNKAYW